MGKMKVRNSMLLKTPPRISPRGHVEPEVGPALEVGESLYPIDPEKRWYGYVHNIHVIQHKAGVRAVA